ncbi:MAG: hypothetical protein WA047_13780 [Phenylobacterium sp.]|uniref:hypothetical protein n=1 Tax=Phenylobacterium sp. TaxID=1871053 RepID=UPI003BB77C40
MKVRPWAEFVSDLPDDGVEDDTGFVLYPGRGVAEAIGEHLNKAGYRVSPPEHRWERGWDFEFWASERRFWCQVSDLDEYFLLVCRDMRRTLTDNLLRRPPNALYVEVLNRLNDALTEDPRFHDIRWKLDKEMSTELPGASSPVSDN